MTLQGLSSLEDPPGSDPAVSAAIEVPAGIGSPFRPVRALIGWVPPGPSEQVLASNRMDIPLTEEQRARFQAAREAVAARAAGIDQDGLVTDLPSALAGHVERLRATAAGEQMFREGWDVRVVDLERIVAFQPHVFTDTAVPRAAALDADDLEAVAELTLPTSHEVAIEAQYDQIRGVWLVISPNPNLRVVSPFNLNVNGLPGFGFAVAVPAPYVQVASFEGRHILRDGYHRAFGLLSRGITHVPAFVRNFESVENLVPPGMLPHNAWLGPRPPVLRDYHDDAVAADVDLPASRKMIAIHSLELSPNN
jgi:hypothetical protein